MDLTNLEKVSENEPKYRLEQAKDEIFKNLIDDWRKAGSFPMELREKLNAECPLAIKAEVLESKKEGSVKARIILKDGLKVETVLLNHRDGPARNAASIAAAGGRNTVCVSSQVGCPLGCLFCATGKMGFKRNLESLEIVEQALFFSRLLNRENKRVTNVVFMGMGEPFLNYENVISAVKIINGKNGLNIGARFISISTVGIVEGIKKLSEENLQVNLAISLHAPNNPLREKIIPSAKKYSIEEILKAVDGYIKKTKRQVMFEYILISGVNDSDECAFSLAKLMKKPLYFLNLILYNQTGEFKPSSQARVKKFKEILEKERIYFSQRHKFGQDIKAACGQFTD